MNAKRFRQQFLVVTLIYAIAIIALFALRGLDTNDYPTTYNTFKDALPLIIAIPAAWLGYSFQRRQAYLRCVRELWSGLGVGVQEAIQYTHLASPSQEDFGKVLKTLSLVTEELRAVFSNVDEAEGAVGLYPFERIKEIHGCVSSLSFGSGFQVQQAATVRRDIVKKWKMLRKHFLSELERGVPADPDSPYLQD